ncbi:MAG: LacI family DNA-binding transcriptional regulator [Anaerolineae bacterium]|nr:LacI family DNA-binding transcriptional regulator [Anaerolineae bacterium]
MTVTLRELAKAAGVSVTTASRVLNNSDHAVSHDARARVFQVAAELGYRPNIAARTLRMDRSFTIGIVADSITVPFTTAIFEGIENTLNPEGYFCVIISLHNDTSLQRKAIDSLLSRGVDGLIVVDTWDASAIPYLQRLQKPYAFCQRLFGTAVLNSVIADNAYGAEMAVMHLLNAGHRRIGFINGKETYYMARDRLQGYINAHRRFGAIIDPQLIMPSTWELDSGYDAALKLLEQPDRPTAIFTANDMLAVGSIYAANDRGLKVPDDLAIVGFDDQPMARIIRPSLTTITYPTYQMGVEAARILLQQINGEREFVDEVAVQGELIVRDSCGLGRRGAGER